MELLSFSLGYLDPFASILDSLFESAGCAFVIRHSLLAPQSRGSAFLFWETTKVHRYLVSGQHIGIEVVKPA